MACDEAYPIEVYAIAAVVWREARSESLEGKLAVIDAIRNRSEYYNESLERTTHRGMKSGKLEPELVELVAGALQNNVRGRYRHWIRLGMATDKRQIRIAKRAIKKGEFLKVGNHFFY